MGIVEGNSSFVTVQTHPQPGWERSRVGVRHVAAAATVGMQSSLALAVTLALSVTMSLWEQHLSHAHGEEAEGRGVLAILCLAVMPTVWVAAGRGAQGKTALI